eukprot:5949249-Heterocapsa_arctica.AAC.1
MRFRMCPHIPLQHEIHTGTRLLNPTVRATDPVHTPQSGTGPRTLLTSRLGSKVKDRHKIRSQTQQAAKR